MSNYWAIAIGINQYQHFQPLLYAQWDAQALWDYWVKEGGIPHHQCLLLTDGLADGQITDTDAPLTPTKEGIEKQLLQLGHHRLGTDDLVWCFFSGYGVNIQGQDYLVPLDASLQQLEQTSISAAQFFSILQAFPTDRVLVLLDVKRMPGTGTEMRLGDDIARQAQKSGMATIVASQPDQLSYETLTLRQGLFTATVLEGLRTHGCSQLGQLAQYVQNRLPELSEYHWRPRQEAKNFPSDS
ncbi:MAG: hypothetical protein F6K16_14835 [Symploca sp. SIO2B6]|nr:hypothetical protein [Symploca sp. SIO2B6]